MGQAIFSGLGGTEAPKQAELAEIVQSAEAAVEKKPASNGVSLEQAAALLEMGIPPEEHRAALKEAMKAGLIPVRRFVHGMVYHKCVLW